MGYTDPTTWVAGATLPAADLNTYVRDNFRWLHDRGGDLASATSITPTTGFHKITGTTTIDSIASPVSGHEVALWFQSQLTVRNNGGGTGNIRTATGSDTTVAAGQIRVFRSDGTVWQEVGVGAALGLQIVADTSLGADAASIDIQNISGGAHLLFNVYARSDRASASDDLGIRLNNDSGANYDRQVLRFTGNTPALTGGQTFGATIHSLPSDIPANSAGANLFGQAVTDIASHANTTNNKVMMTTAALKTDTSTAVFVGMVAGFWRSNAAVTRVASLPVLGTVLKAGSRMSVYTY